MNLADCYRLLGLSSKASFDEIKGAYRRLARKYHPDVNPGDQKAHERFIEITTAYKFLLANLPTASSASQTTQPFVTIRHKQNSQATTDQESKTKPATKPSPVQFNPDLSLIEQQLKLESYQQLQQHLKAHRYPRAIALVEGLAQRIPQDPEIVQWQAIVYQRWGRQLIQERQFDKARLYLKKALRTDPHNRSLWAEVERDFQRLEQHF